EELTIDYIEHFGELGFEPQARESANLAAYEQPMVRLRNPGDNAEVDICFQVKEKEDVLGSSHPRHSNPSMGTSPTIAPDTERLVERVRKTTTFWTPEVKPTEKK